jgi:putative aldouronate transport system substrate-binding protein
VDPDILLVSTFDQLREKIYRQQIGLMWDMWAEFTKPPHGDQLKKMLPDAKWIQIAPVSGPRGSSNGIYSIPGPRTSGIVLSAKLPSDKAKFKAVLNYLDYLNTAEGYNTVSYGVEGTHFKVEGGKVVVDMVKAGDVSNAWQHQICGRAERQYLYTKFPGITADIGFVSSLKHTTVYNAFEVIPEGINKADKNKFEAEQMTRFILGQRPIAEFDAFVSTLNGTFKQELYTKSVEDNLRKAGILK